MRGPGVAYRAAVIHLDLDGIGEHEGRVLLGDARRVSECQYLLSRGRMFHTFIKRYTTAQKHMMSE
mgnify:CR=1 FL=1